MCDSCVSIFLAKVIGVFLFLISLGMLIHQQRHVKLMNEFLGSPSLVNFSGVIGIILGLLIVGFHNVWVSGWPVLITLIGWLILFQGVWRIFFPDSYARTIKNMMTDVGYIIWSWIWLLIGIFLIWLGFSDYHAIGN